MNYVQVTRSPGQTMADYEEITRELGPERISGHLQHHVGMVDGDLVIVDVWQSRTHADRFAAERLFPAFERSGRSLGAGAEIIAFEPAVSGIPA
jgi:hypothetical protein